MDWSTWKGATCLPDCWCEAARIGSWILEPVNTWTNLAFVFAGLYFLFKSNKLKTNEGPLSSTKAFPLIYGFACIFVGLGSFFYHASQTFVGQWFDVFGMYLVAVFYIFYNLYRLKKINIKKFYIGYWLSCIILGVVIIYFPLTRRWLFGICIAIALFQSIYINKKTKPDINVNYLWLSVASYAIAQGFWILDKERIWCDPYGWINGHGIWHLMCAVAAVFIYLYFQSEKFVKTQSVN